MAGDDNDTAGRHGGHAPGRRADAVPLRRYTNFLRRNRMAVTLVLLAGILLSAARLVTGEATYTSTVNIFVPPVALHTGLGLTAGTTTTVREQAPRQSTIDTEAQLAQSDPVLTALSRTPGFRIDRARLRERILITVPTSTRVLNIRVRAYSPEHARAGARVLAQTYLDLRQRIVADIQKRNLRVLENNRQLLRAQLRILTEGRRNAAAKARLEPTNRRAELASRIVAVEEKIATNSDRTPQFGEIVLGPTAPQQPDDRRVNVLLSSGLGLGLLCGLLLGLIQDRRPRRIRSVADVRRAVALPVLAEISHSPEGPRDAARRLRNVIHREEASVVLLTGVSGSATEPLAHALATVFGQAGQRAALLRVGTAGPPGDTLGGGEPGTKLAGELSVFGVPSGGDGQLSAAIRRARRDTDLVVVTGPALHSPEAVILATICDLTFVLVALSRVSVDELASGAAYLAYAASPARGLVLTRHGGGTLPYGTYGPRSQRRPHRPYESPHDPHGRNSPHTPHRQIISSQTRGSGAARDQEGTPRGS